MAEPTVAFKEAWEYYQKTFVKGYVSGSMEKKKKPEEVVSCNFCGPFMECSKKYHTAIHIEDMLIDSGICNNAGDLKKWWSSPKYDDKDSAGDPILLGYTPEVVAGVFLWRVAKYVRKVL